MSRQPAPTERGRLVPVRRLTRAVAVLAVLGTVVTGCTSGGSSSSTLTASQRLSQAKHDFDRAKFIHITLNATTLPTDLPAALQSADGTGTHAPAFTGTVEVRTGLTITAPVVAVNDTVYAKFPFAGWTRLDPAKYGAPDPANLLDRQSGVSALLVETQQPKRTGSRRSGHEVLSTISGTLPGQAVHRLFPSSGGADFTVVYTLSSDNHLTGMTITGPFYAGHSDATYKLDLDTHATPVTIRAP